MATSRRISRRGLLKKGAGVGAVGLAAPYFVPSRVLAKAGQPGANDVIGVGYIGTGRRGKQLAGLPKGARAVAVSDVYTKRMDEFPGSEKLKRYQDYRELLGDPNVDAVVIATPDHWHALNAIHALEAGKDVYCEKPMTLTVREGRAMVEATRKHKRVFQTGSQQRSMAASRRGCELTRNGRIGKILKVIGANYPSPFDTCDASAKPVPEGLNWDMWCGQTEPRPFNAKLYLPRPHPTGWISYRRYSGGEMTGWGSHGFDLIQWALGTDETGPVEVWPEGSGRECAVGYKYASGIVMMLGKEAPGGGGIFVGDKGKIKVDRGKYQTWPESIGKEPLGDSDTRLYVSDNHRGNWVDCIRSRKKPVADVEIGHRSATICHLGNIARWTGRRLKWDPEKEIFLGDDEANALLERPMRKPYAL